MTRETCKVRIDLPSFRIEVESEDPAKTLPEIRRIVEAMRVDEDVAYEAFVTQELQQTFSDAFTKNPQAMSNIKKLIAQEEDYRTFTMEIPSTAAIDLENGSRATRIQLRDVKRAVARIATAMDGSEVKSGIVHVAGPIERDDRMLIVDHIHTHMPTAHLRAFHSKERDQVLVECIFFGTFPEED